ncbi:hypothetical protein Tco_1338000 [Tanacetum coccineum]
MCGVLSIVSKRIINVVEKCGAHIEMCDVLGNDKAIDESVVEPSKSEEEKPLKEVDVMNEVERRVDDKPAKSVRENVMKNEEEKPARVSSSHAVARINEKLIEGLVENQKINDFLSAARVGKRKRKTYNLLPGGPVHDSILKKKVSKKEDIRGNFEIPCNIGGLKPTNVLVDQGSNVNVMPLSTYNKITDERLAETNIRLSLASHSYIYPLGITEVVLVYVAAKDVIKFDKGTITLRSGKSKINFNRIPEPHCRIEKGIKNDIEPIALTMTVNRLVIEWEEKIKLLQEKEMKFDQWRSKIFNYERP